MGCRVALDLPARVNKETRHTAEPLRLQWANLILFHTSRVFPSCSVKNTEPGNSPTHHLCLWKKFHGGNFGSGNTLFLIHLLHVPPKTELILVSQRAEEVPAFTQFIKVLMEDNYELNYIKSNVFHALSWADSSSSMFANSLRLQPLFTVCGLHVVGLVKHGHHSGCVGAASLHWPHPSSSGSCVNVSVSYVLSSGHP